jgi:hypothetical protein
MEEINEKEDFYTRLRFLIGYRTSPEGLSDKCEKPLLESGVEVEHIRCPKPDTPILTGQKIMKELREN